jgi:hypothetical protein
MEGTLTMTSTKPRFSFDTDWESKRRALVGKRFGDVDTYEGVASEPMHLHKYLYASGDPVDRVDPSGKSDFTLSTQMVTAGVIGGLATLGFGIGYKITGTIRGAFWGALGGAANGVIISLYKGKGLIKANLMAMIAGTIASVDAYQDYLDGKQHESETEAFIRGYSTAMAVAAATVVVADKLGPVMTRGLNDPELAISVMSGAVVELGMSVVNGNLWKHPWRTFVNVAIHAGVSYATKRYGQTGAPYARDKEQQEMLERLYSTLAGWAASRINDMVQDAWKYLGPNAAK